MDITQLPSQGTLEAAPLRAFKFLIGIASSPLARAALSAKGFDANEHAYAWSRLQKLGQTSIPSAKLDNKVRAALDELDVWDEPHYDAMGKTLLRQFPAQLTYVFSGVEAAQGSAAALGVELVLDRLDNLESGNDRDPQSREADAAAVALLAKRGYTKEERARLRSLVNTTKTVTSPAEAAPNAAERNQILIELYQWLSEWSAQARTCITSRRALIQLGLAKPRTRAGDESGDGGNHEPPRSVPDTTVK